MSGGSPHKVIRASAGSGKTFALSSRYLSLLRRGAHPDEILATTFTRKAAGEILGRVLQRLADAASSAEGAAALERDLSAGAVDLAGAGAMLEQVREHIGALAISTLDSFFHRMAGCFRFELGLPRRPMLVGEGHPAARQLRREAIDAMLGDEAPQVLIGLLRRLHHDAAQRRITDAIDDVVGTLYDVYRQTEGAAWHRLAPPLTLDRKQVIEATALLRDAETMLPDNRFVKAWQSDLVSAESLDWEGFLCGGLAGRIAAGEETYYKKGIPAAVVEAYRPLVVHARATIVKRVAEQTAATHALLARFDAHYTRLRRERGLLLFADLPLMLSRQAFVPGAGDGPEELGLESLYYRLDGRVQHLLLDEFQDTSPLQWRVLRPFAEEIRSGEGGLARDGGPPRSFFCVGDVKQAIYGWRDGCAEVFDQALSDLNLPGEVVEERSTSWRTAQAVLDVVNEVFEALPNVPPLGDLREHAQRWARGFQQHRAQDPTRRGYVRVEASPPVADGEDAWDAHLDFVAERVAELTVAHPGASIGVLVRINDTGAAVLRKLRDLGVSASGEGGSSLTRDPAVETILSALVLADHPGHTAAGFAVRHSPLGKALGLVEEDGDAALQGAAARVRRSLLDHGYAETITRWAGVLSDHCNMRSVERLTQLIELAELHDAAATLRARDFVRLVEATDVADPAQAGVRVMTVHKAKGLEFDVVVLAELGDAIGNTSRVTLWQYRPTPTSASTAVYRSVKKELRAIVGEYAPNVLEAREQEVGRRVADDLSALYVAMTRPRHALHIVLQPLKRNKEGWGKAGLGDACPASILRHVLTDMRAPLEAGVLYEHGDEEWDVHRSAPAATGVRGGQQGVKVRWASGDAKRGWSVVSPSRLTEGAAIHGRDLISLDHRQARLRGTDVHEALAAVAWLDEVDEGGLAEPVRAVLAKPAIRELFVRPALPCELWRERAYALKLEGMLVQGRFDRVVFSDGRATVIDFKTDRVASQPQRLVDHYRPQMESYRAAVSMMRGLPRERVGVRIAFVSEGMVVDL